MTIPETTSENLINSLNDFDENYRSNAEWVDWNLSRKHKHAIKYNGNIYPMKFIISLATGMNRQEFSGGEESIRYIKGRNLDVVSLHLPEKSVIENYFHDEILSNPEKRTYIRSEITDIIINRMFLTLSNAEKINLQETIDNMNFNSINYLIELNESNEIKIKNYSRIINFWIESTIAE